ncbi:MAG: adenylosuccinate synthase [bacterium JZ-2024 1]
MSKLIAIIGAQWGDEGKGKVVDFLAPSVDIFVRFNGGSNAGHTVMKKGKEFKFHLLPSGCLHAGKISMISSGVVVDIPLLLEELQIVRDFGIESPILCLSPRAHIVMPYHKKLDEGQEKLRGKAGIGTTLRGIGPAYMDRTGRMGIQVGDLFCPEVFEEKIDFILKEKNTLFEHLYHIPPLSKEEILREYHMLAETIKSYVCDCQEFLQREIRAGKTVLFEGAQGTLLDICSGTYPYVTSSHTTVSAIGLSTGVPPGMLTDIVGVSKAYCTRVGGGVFPTEISGPLGEHIREKGKEYGATTGRPRRVGWLDLVLLRYAASINGFTALAITKIDVLNNLDTVRMAVAYKYGNRLLEFPPEDLSLLQKCEPIYEEFPGWTSPDTFSLDSLHPHLIRYLEFIRKEVKNIPLYLLSFSPEASGTIALQ